jgi:hypothetical protein
MPPSTSPRASWTPPTMAADDEPSRAPAGCGCDTPRPGRPALAELVEGREHRAQHQVLLVAG